jgi:hypothetical protein
MNDVVLEAMGSLDVDALSQMRERLEEVAELAEGFEPVSREWSRRIDVQIVRMAVDVSGHRIEFEIDRERESVSVVSVQRRLEELPLARTATTS